MKPGGMALALPQIIPPRIANSPGVDLAATQEKHDGRRIALPGKQENALRDEPVQDLMIIA
jgi:hypothetical protein